MGAIKLKKTNWLRRRFAFGPELSELDFWMDSDLSLRQKILTDSTYQLVGKKSILEISTKTKKGRLLLEVVGIPKENLPTFDFPPQETLVYEVQEEAFKVDFSALFAVMDKVTNGASHSINDTCHIVLEGAKLELHFFIQKDYIHS